MHAETKQLKLNLRHDFNKDRSLDSLQVPVDYFGALCVDKHAPGPVGFCLVRRDMFCVRFMGLLPTLISRVQAITCSVTIRAENSAIIQP